MGAGGGGKTKKAAAVGMTPSISFDGWIQPSQAAGKDGCPASRCVQTHLMQTRACLLSPGHGGCSVSM